VGDSCSKLLLNEYLAAQWVFNFVMACMVGAKGLNLCKFSPFAYVCINRTSAGVGFFLTGGFHSDWSGLSVDAFMNVHGSNYGSMPLST
jgi:hypothetical protein